MTTKYKPGNKFAARIPLADAAVDWQGVPTTHWPLITVDDEGLPVLAALPDLRDRAEAILGAVQAGKITGAVCNEDGYFLSPQNMHLDRESVATWIAQVERRLSGPATVPPVESATNDALLTKQEVCDQLNVSKATLDRMRNRVDNPFPEPTQTNPNRWLQSVVNAFKTKQVIDGAKASRLTTFDDDI